MPPSIDAPFDRGLVSLAPNNVVVVGLHLRRYLPGRVELCGGEEARTGQTREHADQRVTGDVLPATRNPLDVGVPVVERVLGCLGCCAPASAQSCCPSLEFWLSKYVMRFRSCTALAADWSGRPPTPKVEDVEWIEDSGVLEVFCLVDDALGPTNGLVSPRRSPARRQ